MGLEIDACSEYDLFFPLAGFNPGAATWNGHAITLTDAPSIAETLASRIQAWLIEQDPHSPDLLRKATYFAHLGSEGLHRDLVDRDIVELLDTPEGLMARGVDGVVVPASWWSNTQNFCKNHATAILVGVALVAVAVTVIIVTAGTGAGIAAAAGGAALNNLSSNDEEKKKTPLKKTDPPLASAPPPPALLKAPDNPFTSPTSPPVISSLRNFLARNLPEHLAPSSPPFSPQQRPFEEPPAKSPFLEKLLTQASPPTDWIAPGPPPENPLPPPASPFPPFFFCDPEAGVRPHTTWGPAPKSTYFATSGPPLPHGKIGWINGIGCSFDESHQHAKHLSSYANQHCIEGVYNQSHRALFDIPEVVLLNYQGYSAPADLLIENWTKFSDDPKNEGMTKYLQICHSQGAVHVKNALNKCPDQLRQKIIVLAIAPAAIIPKELCYNSFNYASKRDVVPLGITALNTIIPIRELLTSSDHLDELIWLDPHEDAPFFDHGFDSPTFDRVKREHIEAITGIVSP